MPLTFLPAITGSFATPAAENPTVAMIEAAYRHHDIDARYLNTQVEPAGLADAVSGARAMVWVGFNCSLPHKVAVIEHLDGLSRGAEIMGAVNLVVRDGDRLIGHNSDGAGFLRSLRTMTDPSGASVVLLGAGGAARAIAVELALAGAAHITVVNRDPARGQVLAALINERTPCAASYDVWQGAYAVPEAADIVVNATSIGLFPDVEDAPPVDASTLRPGLIVADVIPNPPDTRFLRTAAERGCSTLDGLGMLVNQGVISIRLWTGVEVDPEVMRQTLTDIFGG
jgi:shikimate dehydrogenase